MSMHIPAALRRRAPTIHVRMGSGALLLSFSTVRLDAQETAGWQRSAQVSANVWYGGAHTRVVSSELSVGHADSSFSMRAGLRFGYADDRDADGPRVVTARATEGSLGIDYRPFDRWSPFLLGSGETNLQQRIASRVSASEARVRGAQSNNDGQFLLGLRARF